MNNVRHVKSQLTDDDLRITKPVFAPRPLRSLAVFWPPVFSPPVCGLPNHPASSIQHTASFIHPSICSKCSAVGWLAQHSYNFILCVDF